jgi:hypothetical protein
MSKFLGGSAFAMVRDIGEGYVIVTERTFKGMVASEIQQLLMEVDRYLRELRGTQSAKDELPVVQARNRRIQRLNSANMIARLSLQKLQR